MVTNIHRGTDYSYFKEETSSTSTKDAWSNSIFENKIVEIDVYQVDGLASNHCIQFGRGLAGVGNLSIDGLGRIGEWIPLKMTFNQSSVTVVNINDSTKTKTCLTGSSTPNTIRIGTLSDITELRFKNIVSYSK